MKRIELVRFAAGAIFAHPMRSALTTLGIVIGVGAVICMTSIGLGASANIKEQISALGSNMLIIQSASARGAGSIVNQGGGSAISIDTKDAQAIRDNVQHIAAVSSAVQTRTQLIGEGTNWNSTVYGVDATYLTVRDLKIASGRMFEEGELSKKVLVIGQTVATNLFQDNDPLGQRIRVGTVPFEVIGVLKSRGQSSSGQDQDDLAIGPLVSVRSRVVGRRVRGEAVQNIFVKADSEQTLDKVQTDIDALLRERHKIQPGADANFQIQNLTSVAQASQQSTKTFTILLAAVAGVSLVVGGVGIMNIMLVAVTERTREIGLRMALGATRGDILSQFALEAVTLSLIGGLIGLALGVIAAFIVGQVGGWPTQIPSWAAPLSLGFSMFDGLVFGAYPSYRAAQLDPIEALRRD